MRELTTKIKPIAIALGYFDCVHFAHRKIISKTIDYARTNQLKSAVFTFSNEPSNKSGGSIYTFKERKRLIAELDADYIVSYCFNNELKNMTASAFLDMLFEKYNIKYICCGNDYRFGSNGEGNVEFLREYAGKHNVAVEIFDSITVRGEIVSTTLIKKELTEGNIKKANELLCSPYFIEGKVSIGKGRGQGLGFPTANIKPSEKFLPKLGVYKSRTFIDGKIFPSITNIGTKPTFNDETLTVETHIDGNVFNLYSKTIRVELFDYIRELKKFSSAAQLKEQIRKDVQQI